MRCHPRFFAAARRIASRSASSATCSISAASGSGSFTAGGAVRTSFRVFARSGGSTGPTRKRSDSTAMPRALSCARIGSHSIESSCAHVALAART
nr:hypothetical protein [Polyangium jinanense]